MKASLQAAGPSHDTPAPEGRLVVLLDGCVTTRVTLTACMEVVAAAHPGVDLYAVSLARHSHGVHPLPFVSLRPAPEMGGHAKRVWEQERKALLGHPAIRAQDPSGTLSMALLALLQDHDLCEVFNKLPGRRHFKGTGDVGDAGGGVYCRWRKFTVEPPSPCEGTHPSLVRVLAAVGAEIPTEESPSSFAMSGSPYSSSRTAGPMRTKGGGDVCPPHSRPCVETWYV